MITDYKVIFEGMPEELTKSVRQAIGEGWQPLGGVSTSVSESDEYAYYSFAQAMVKYAEK